MPWRTLAAAFWLALASLPAAAADPVKPIEGHDSWKLGMTLAEAQAAEPRAERRVCAESICLHYEDRRFPSAKIAVSARFDAADALDVIVVTMAVKPGDNRCKRVYAQLAAFYTAAHGETLPISREAWMWSSPEASLTLLSNCDAGERGVINILFESLAAAG